MNNRVISLYRQLIKYSQELRLTDRDYFCDEIRKAFKLSKNLNKEQIEIQLEVFFIFLFLSFLNLES